MMDLSSLGAYWGKIRSGLSGESEPLWAFGVFLTDANVKAH